MTLRNLETTVINTWGDQGKHWLQQIPTIIDALKSQWQLSDITPYSNLSYHYVGHAEQQGNKAVVVKFGCDRDVIAKEKQTLRHFAGNGMVKLLDSDDTNNALLLERLTPGQSLKQDSDITKQQAMDHYCQVVNQLATASNHSLSEYTHYSQWCLAIDRIESQHVSDNIKQHGATLYRQLIATNDAPIVCHGDLHCDNVIQHHNSWKAIDPKGIIAETAFEAAAFDLLEPQEWQHDAQAIQLLIIQRSQYLATQLKLPPQRLLQWFFVRSLMHAQWFIEDNCPAEKAINTAKHIYSALNSAQKP